MSAPLPMVPLGEALTQYRDYIAAPEPRLYPKLSVKLYGKGVVLDGTADGSLLKMKRHQVAKAGQVILSEIWGKKGAVGFVPPDGGGALCTSHFFLFDVQKDRVEPAYLQALFTANYLERQLGSEAKGTTGYAATRPKHLLAAMVPLPPLPEQRRIVARIEEVAAKIEEARGLRQAATQEASTLVRRARDRVFRVLSGEFVSVRLDSVADCRLGKMLSPDAKLGMERTPYLRNANIRWDGLDLSSVYEMHFSEAEREMFGLRPGDVLVCEGGDIGKAALWNDEIPGCCFQKALHRIRVDRARLVPRYLLHHMFWASEQGHFADIKTQTTIAHLTGVKLKAYGVLVPPLPEQQQIMAHLDQLQARVGGLSPLQSDVAAELDAVLPSLLDKAFKGEL